MNIFCYKTDTFVSTIFIKQNPLEMMKSSEKFEKQLIRSDLYNIFNENCSSYIIKVRELFKPALLKSDLNQILKKIAVPTSLVLN